MIFNRCQECGVRIPWVKRAYFGNTYHPVVCEACALASAVRLYGSEEAYRAAMAEAVGTLSLEMKRA
jgi:hypothetical protein